MHACCQCGNLTAEIADQAEAMIVMCHCIDCQKRSGSPFGAIAYYPAPAVSIAGQAREYSRAADSGHSLTTGFCPDCGSTVYAKPSRMPDMVGVTVGAIGDPAFERPARSVYEQSRHHWIELPATIEGYTRGRDSERSR
jgi:hypothetical protein